MKSLSFASAPLRGEVLWSLALLFLPTIAASQSLGISARYDHAITSDDDGSTSGLVSTNQVAFNARVPVRTGHLYGTLNSRVGRGYTELGSRGAELGYDHGPWFVGFGQSTGTEFSWITATAVTGNVGNLSLLSAFPKRALAIGVRASPVDSFRVISHDEDGTRPSPGRGVEWSWVRKTDSYTVRLADYRQSSRSPGVSEPRQTGGSVDVIRTSWAANLRLTDLRLANGEGVMQVGLGARRLIVPTLSLVADSMVSQSDLQERDYRLFAAGAFWAFHSKADAYVLGYRIRNDPQALRLIGPAKGRRLGDDPRGVAFGVRVRIGFEL